MSSDTPPFSFDEIISDERNDEGRYTCPICGEYRSDSIRSIKGHISGSRDAEHADLGWNYEAEIEATDEE
ncbi:hypothetical protein [Natronomonas amylolytica]|uniref:hypothetical protein n=1 Tax=Natronomonas amylolytica TaxID=3108498 RepID=UPI00300BD8E7